MHSSSHYKFNYDGKITEDITISIFEVIKKSLRELKLPEHKPTKLLSTVLELLDNAQRYGDNTPVEFDLHLQNRSISIKISNVTDEYHSERMKMAINKIQMMSQEEVRESYKQVLNDGTFNIQGGAGLGYLRIARNGMKSISIEAEPTVNNNYRCTCNIVCHLE